MNLMYGFDSYSAGGVRIADEDLVKTRSASLVGPATLHPLRGVANARRAGAPRGTLAGIKNNAIRELVNRRG
ncbi:hypothetical protein SAMN05421783_11241 [Thiocapsa roseopersicina]|uniref:Uncharacterized protein n=1 Tax=Thiocapsa roseopersicina TaxID=1058 RepID=A0A1H2Y687_THIRO|nr:hypothetical protein SAMN05421783_11241 [Thiocapsa roseopersicina]